MVMATIPKHDFFTALGREISEAELETALFDLGMELEEYGNEDIIVEITPERLDLLSAQGLARALKHFLGMNQEFPTYELRHEGNYQVNITAGMQQVRPHTVCAVIKNISLTEERLKTIIALQEKLHATLGRNRKRGAIGIYPMDKITWPIAFTAAAPEAIRFLPLEAEREMTAQELLLEHPTGKEYAHLLADFKHYPYFVDAANQILSVPPIINSQSTGRVTTDTTELFIECSGHELAVLEKLLTHLTIMFADMGGEIYAVTVNYENQQSRVTPDFTPLETTFVPLKVRTTIGINLAEEEIETHLRRMMHEVVAKNNDGSWTVKSPRFRYDIWHQIDLIDDVARAYGYNNIPQTLPQVDGIGTTLPLSDLREELSEILVGFGYLETYTFSLTGKDEQLHNMQLDEANVSYVPVANGNENQTMLRMSLLPQQLQLLANNRNRPLPQKIFEGDFVVVPDASQDVMSRNEMHFSALLTDKTVTFTQIKQLLDATLATRGIKVTVQTGSHPSFLQGRVGTVLLDGKPIGVIGELHPQVLTNFGIQSPVAAFEINLESLLE